jgi:hypothetical protein
MCQASKYDFLRERERAYLKAEGVEGARSGTYFSKG